MKKTFLLVIETDPRQSGRPAEAVRVAAGLSAWKKVEVHLYFHGPAVLSLREDGGELVDEENFRQCLPILKEFGWPAYVEKGSRWLAEIGTAVLPWVELGPAELADVLTRFDYSARF